ncbi:MAG: hypothetical protein R6W31_19740 [Bacteroidales bacterium]
MSKTHKGIQDQIRPRFAKIDHETKSEIKYKILTGYYFEEEKNDPLWQI